MQVVKQDGDQTFDDMNTSMAGLSDVSVGEIQRLGNLDDSQADFANTSMASLGDAEELTAGDTGSGSTGNILDSLKLSLPAQNLNDSKIEDIKKTYRKTDIFEEGDEDDYDEEDDEEAGGTGQQRKSITRKSPKTAKLTDLISSKRSTNPDESIKSIEERKSTIEDSPEKHLASTNDTFKLGVKTTQDDEDSDSSSEKSSDKESDSEMAPVAVPAEGDD